jgi:hypothetical protein
MRKNARRQAFCYHFLKNRKRYNMFRTIISVVLVSMCLCGFAVADDHQHADYEVLIGAFDGSLDVQLPDTILLEYDNLSGSYISEHLCWISTEPLTTTDALQPTWSIELEKITVSSGLTVLNEQYQEILTTGNFLLGEPVWEDGEGWHFHNHTLFAASGAEPGDTFAATFRVVDAGGVYQSSEPFTLNFTVVPEPVSALLLGVGAFMLRRRRH